MKRRWKIVAAIALGGVFGALLIFNSGRSAREAWMETRNSLRRAGFKLDLAEFNPSIAAEITNRAETLARDELALRKTFFGGVVETLFFGPPVIMSPADSNSAVVVWRQADVKFLPRQPLWPAARAFFEENKAVLDEARKAALSGPIRFADVAGPAAVARVGEPIKRLADEFAVGAVLELHEGKPALAWTNLMVATRLATAWNPGPLQEAQVERYHRVITAFNTAWQVLQADDWTDEQLAKLQQEWESADFLANLPDLVAYRRVSAAKTCAESRLPARAEYKPTEVFHSWWNAVPIVKGCWEQFRYQRTGSYADERNLMLYFRDRELEMRRAISCPSWLDMDGIITAGTATPFTPTAYPVAAHSVSRLQWNLGLEQKNDCAASAAFAEIRRGIVITAVAVKRYHAKHGSYPGTLQALVPDFLPRPPTDFLDGAPLRYVLNDGRFMLYSIGIFPVHELPVITHGSPRPRITRFVVGPGERAELVWPLPDQPGDMADSKVDARGMTR